MTLGLHVVMPVIDLHLHTTVSDGTWTPERLYAHLRELPIELCSITDHDTMDVYPLPAGLAPRTITGMEVDTKCDGQTAHLLVYGIGSSRAPLLERLVEQRACRRKRMAAMVERLRVAGFSVTMEDVEAEAGTARSLGRPHLARALVRLGAVSSVQEAFDKHIADDREHFVSLERLESAEAIELAHGSGAIVSIAHPCRLARPALLDRLRAFGADAVEVVHPTADAAMQRELLDYIHRYDLVATGGSDFHAPGASMPGIGLPRGDFEHLLDLFGPRASGTEFDSKSGVERTDATARSSAALESLE